MSTTASTEGKKGGKAAKAGTTPSVNTYVISAAELPKDISFEYNARSPSRASRAYKSMRETLAKQPERFIELNGGISLASGRYILDGGHTVSAVMDAIKEDNVDPKRVHLAVRDYGEKSPTEMGALSAALNRRVTPPLMGEKDLEGVWNPIKEQLSSKLQGLFEFRPNTKPDAPYDVSFLVALLHAWTETKADRAYSGKGQLVRLFHADKYSRVLPLLNEALDLYAHVYKTIVGDKKLQKLQGSPINLENEVVLPNGERFQGTVPESMVWPTFASLSALMNDRGEWTSEPKAELTKKWGKIVKQITEDYKTAGFNPGQYGKSKDAYLNANIALRSA